MTFVQPGSVVKHVEWEAVPDKYAGPQIFTNLADAEEYAEKTCGRVNVLVTFPEGLVRLFGDIAAGDVVLRVRYRLQRWSGMTGPVEFDAMDAAVAAVPPGKKIGVYQVLWIGQPGSEGVEAIGDTVSVTGGEVLE